MTNHKENSFLLMRKEAEYNRHFCRGWKRTAACLAAVCLLTACGGEEGGSQSLESNGMESAAGVPMVSGRETPEYISEGRKEVQPGDQDNISTEASTRQEAPLLTFEHLQELIQEPVPLLEHYAGYRDVGSRVHGCEERDHGHISYPIWDSTSGADFMLNIDYRTEDSQICQMGLLRLNDCFNCSLYIENTGSPEYVSDVSSKLEHYREDVGELFHWIKEYRFPANIYEVIRPWQFRADMGAGDWKGQTYWRIGEEPEKEKDSDGEPPEWEAALGIMQIPQEYLVFTDGILQEVLPFYGQAEPTMEFESLEGCGEQAVLWKIHVKPYEEDYWYVCLGHEDSPRGYIAAMNCRHFSEEEAVAFVQSIRFQDAAWQ